MKDECGGRVIDEAIALRPSWKKTKKNIPKAKGVKKSVVEKEIRHEQYQEALFEEMQFWHGMRILRSEGHEIYGMHVNKVSMSPFDTKSWITDDGVHTLAYGHRHIKQ